MTVSASKPGGSGATTRTQRLRGWLGWQAVTVASVAALVAWVGVRSPRFFFAGDKQNQYLPVARDIGRRLREGEWLPVIDPDLGPSGNFALDLQYGLYEPTHWVVAVLLSYADDLDLAALLWAAAYLLVLASGVCALATRLGVAGSWAAATAVGVAASGYLMFWAAPSWIPALVSLAWVPWWWRSVVGPPRPLGLIATGAFAFLVSASGWPATWLIWGALALGYVVEAVVRRAEPGVLRTTVLHLVATAGGGLAALVTVLPLQRAVEFTSRQTSLENNGFLVPNLADLLGFSFPALRGNMETFGGSLEQAPLFFGVWFVAVVVWLVPWRATVLARPALVSSVVAVTVTLLLSQAPSNLGPFRWPTRVAPGVPLFLGVGAMVAVASLGTTVSRARVAGAGATVIAISALGFFRDPVLSRWVIPAALLVGATVVLLVAASRRRAWLTGVAALATTLLLAGWTLAAHPQAGMTDRGTPSPMAPGDLVLDEQPTVVFYPRTGAASWPPQGVGAGFIRLTDQQRTQPGYTSIGQRGWDSRFCAGTAHGDTCPAAPARLLQVEPRTGLTWADLLGYRDVVVHAGAHQAAWVAALGASDDWSRSGGTRSFVRYSRVEPPDAVGRVTAVVGDADVASRDVAHAQQTYAVSSDSGATLVFRDLFWPGYEASLDGESLEVRPLGGTLVTVELPAGSAGTLDLSYQPIPVTLLVAPVAAGLLLIAVAVALSTTAADLRWIRRRAGTRRSASQRS